MCNHHWHLSHLFRKDLWHVNNHSDNYFVSRCSTALFVLQEQILVVCQRLNRCKVENILNQKCIVKNRTIPLLWLAIRGPSVVEFVGFFSSICGNKWVILGLCFTMQWDAEHFTTFWYRHWWQYGVFNSACQLIHWQMLPVDFSHSEFQRDNAY